MRARARERTRGSRVHTCASERKKKKEGEREKERLCRGLSLRRGAKAQVTTGPPCSERSRIFYFPPFGHLLACICVLLTKRGNIWAYKVRTASAPSRRSSAVTIALFVQVGSSKRRETTTTRYYTTERIRVDGPCVMRPVCNAARVSKTRVPISNLERLLCASFPKRLSYIHRRL